MSEEAKYERATVEGVTLSLLEGQSANALITGSLNVQRSIKGLNISVSNEIDLQIPKDTRVVMKNAAKGAAGPKQLSFVWLNTNDPPPNQRSYQLSLAPETSSGDVTRLIDVLREWTNLVDEDDRTQSGLMLVDENGQILGSVDLELDPASQSALEKKQFGDADEPVVISPDANGQVHVTPLSALTAEYGQSTSKIVKGAEYLSRGVIWTSESLTNAMDRSVNKTVSTSSATESPLVFSDRTKSGFQSVHSFTGKAANISARTLGHIAGLASSAGTTVGKRMGLSPDTAGTPQNQSGIRGVLNNSIKGATTLFDSVDASSRHFLNRSQANSVAYTTHKYGAEAGGMMHNFTGTAKHCGLVFLDAKGLGRTALLKGFGKGVVKAKMDNGQVVELKSEDFATPRGSPSSTPISPPSPRSTPPPPLPSRSPKLQAEAAAASGSVTLAPSLPPRWSPSPLNRPSSASSGGWNDPPAYHFNKS